MILHQEGPRHVGVALGERSRRLSVWRWWEGSARDSDGRASARVLPRAFFRRRPVVRCEVGVARGNFHRRQCRANDNKGTCAGWVGPACQSAAHQQNRCMNSGGGGKSPQPLQKGETNTPCLYVFLMIITLWELGKETIWRHRSPRARVCYIHPQRPSQDYVGIHPHVATLDCKDPGYVCILFHVWAVFAEFLHYFLHWVHILVQLYIVLIKKNGCWKNEIQPIVVILSILKRNLAFIQHNRLHNTSIFIWD